MPLVSDPAETHRRVLALHAAHPDWSTQRLATELGCGKTTVGRHLREHKRENETQSAPVPIPPAPVRPARLPDPAPEAGGPAIPEPVDAEFESFDASAPGRWLVLSDVHIPYHDKRTIELAVAEAKRDAAVGVLLNGDTLDFYALSHHYREPDKLRAKEEIEKGRALLEWLRSQFPRARVVYKEGNHCERMRKYLANRAPEIFDLDELRLENLLRAPQCGVEWVMDGRPVMLGKLPVFHGHEFKGGGGVMPARWLLLRTFESAMVGHFHQPSMFTARTPTGREIGMWSLGCACHLKPAYLRNNQWANGWGMVTVHRDGEYEAASRRILKDGRVV